MHYIGVNNWYYKNKKELFSSIYYRLIIHNCGEEEGGSKLVNYFLEFTYQITILKPYSDTLVFQNAHFSIKSFVCIKNEKLMLERKSLGVTSIVGGGLVAL